MILGGSGKGRWDDLFKFCAEPQTKLNAAVAVGRGKWYALASRGRVVGWTVARLRPFPLPFLASVQCGCVEAWKRGFLDGIDRQGTIRDWESPPVPAERPEI